MTPGIPLPGQSHYHEHPPEGGKAENKNRLSFRHRKAGLGTVPARGEL